MRTDTVSLELTEDDLGDALYAVTDASGFLVLAEAQVTGKVTLKQDNGPLGKAVTQIASAVNGQSRPFYLLCLPREMTEAEINQMQEQAFTNRWARFWAMSPEERAQDVQRQVQRISRMAERASQPTADGQANPRAQRTVRRDQRMLSRLAQYAAGLSQAQRMEIKPIMQALGAAVNRLR